MILWLCAVLALAQPGLETLSVRAVISDSKGAAVRDLQVEDVSLSASGATLPITFFERDERPSRVALLIDSSQPMATSYRLQFIDAARSFVASLPENTRISIWTTGDRPTKIVDDLDLGEGGSTREVEASLKRVLLTGGNTILDAVVEAAEDLVKKEGERKIVVFLSGTGPGFANADRHSIVDRVMKTGVEVAGALVAESGESSGGGEVSQQDYDYVFGSLADKTAGRLERSLSDMGAGRAMQSVAADLRSTYRLSFQAMDGQQLRLALQVARPSVKVRLSTPRKETSTP